MTCEQIVESGSIELYLAGKLSESEREALEQHYFACDRCFEMVQVIRATRAALLAAGRPTAAAPIPFPQRKRLMLTIAGVAAAIVAAVVIVPAMLRPVSAPVPLAQAPQPAVLAPELELLARIEPPAYDPQMLRGAESGSAARFQKAMGPYAARDYSAAAGNLAKLVERDPASMDARYFLAICQLLTGQLDSGIPGLVSVIEAGSKASPYVEEARFYLAKAYLKRGSLTQARVELEIVAAQGGDLQGQARDILQHLKPQ